MSTTERRLRKQRSIALAISAAGVVQLLSGMVLEIGTVGRFWRSTPFWLEFTAAAAIVYLGVIAWDLYNMAIERERAGQRGGSS
jgi:hypothetical protein